MQNERSTSILMMAQLFWQIKFDDFESKYLFYYIF